MRPSRLNAPGLLKNGVSQNFEISGCVKQTTTYFIHMRLYICIYIFSFLCTWVQCGWIVCVVRNINRDLPRILCQLASMGMGKM